MVDSRFPVSRGLVPLGLALALPVLCGALRAEEPLPQAERLKSSPVLRHLKPNPVTGEPQTDAERTLARMNVPEGFKVELIAAEPELHQPIAFCWDERGRLWVVEAHSYPAKRPPGEGLDQVLIFADEDGDGRFESRKVFAAGLNLASGIEVGYGGVWIGAAPELLFIPDRDRDDRPDGPPEVLLDGFGYQDTHETLNSFLWGPDGWLYGIQGVFNTARIGKPGVPAEDRPELRAGVWRYHPVRREFEIFAHGGSNPWGLDYDAHGELFMTHCRSYWGRGFTTHVIQGGQFWNQVNGHYAPFIVANPPKKFPEFRNYLLASARYGHGAGGEGTRGSDAVYGGHAHVGTMIYLGDNWPDEYRGRLFTHNLGGHQINHEINRPLGSGYDTVSAGRDMLFCTDPAYVAVDLQSGPDGAVYFIDWVDAQHCHNPNTERWDRSNGRLYRMQWTETFKPVTADLAVMGDLELVAQLAHRNHWFGRTARRLLHERAQSESGVTSEALDHLRTILGSDADPEHRLSALWAADLAGALSDEIVRELLDDASPAVRGWTVRLAAERRPPDGVFAEKLAAMAKDDSSPVVRRFLASAVQRLPSESAWPVIEALVAREEDAGDRNLPYLYWHSLAPLMAKDPERVLALARTTELPQIAEWIFWYAATLEGAPLNRAVASLAELDGEALHKRLAGLWLAMEPRANVTMPAAWKDVAPALYDGDPNVQRLAERLAAVFGDDAAFPRLRAVLTDRSTDLSARQHAFDVLSRARDRASLPAFVALLDEEPFRLPAIRLLSAFDDPSVSAALIEGFASFSSPERSAALATLTARLSYALVLLEAVHAETIARDALTSYHVRQLGSMQSATVDKLVAALWGPIKQTPAEKLDKIAALEKTFNEAPLWAYSGNAGRQHFEALCAACHRLGDLGQQLGPDLTGAGKHGVRYYLENIIDPDAVIGPQYQLTTVETNSDEVIAGLLSGETSSALTLRTAAGESIVPAAEIRRRVTSEKSMMPEALLDALGERQQIELLKFLTGN